MRLTTHSSPTQQLQAENGSESTSLWSDIQIVIRKQLSNPREKYKNMGIMGCLAGVKVLGNPMFIIENENGQGSSAQRSKRMDHKEKKYATKAKR